jgi:hypothetical protein
MRTILAIGGYAGLHVAARLERKLRPVEPVRPWHARLA